MVQGWHSKATWCHWQSPCILDVVPKVSNWNTPFCLPKLRKMLEEIAKTIPTCVSRAPSARLLCFEKVLQWMRGSNLSLLDGGYRKLAGLQRLDIPSKHSPYDPFRQFLLTTSKFNGSGSPESSEVHLTNPACVPIPLMSESSCRPAASLRARIPDSLLRCRLLRKLVGLGCGSLPDLDL